METFVLYPIRFLCVGAIVALMAGVRLRPWMTWGLAGLGLLAYMAAVQIEQPASRDFRDYFWKAGRALHEGKNPYDPAVMNPPVVNPPTAFPLFLVFGTLSFPVARMFWSALLIGGALVLAELSGRILARSGDDAARKMDGSVVLLLTAMLCQSRANRFGIDLGQLALLVTLCIYGAIYARAAGWPILGGGLMALASVKTPTMLPSLLLFHRKSDWRLWLAMTVTGVGLVLTLTAPGDIVPRCRECLENIGKAREPGKIDDYDIKNRMNSGMIGMNLLVSHLGVEDRGLVGVLNIVTVIGLGLWIGWLLMGPRPLPRPAACAVVCVYAMLFLYHRLYDLLFLALPLVYAVGHGMIERGRARWLFGGAAVCMMVALNVPMWVLEPVRQYVLAHDGMSATLLRAVVLPYLTWLLLLTLVLLVLAERARLTASGVKGEPGA